MLCGGGNVALLQRGFAAMAGLAQESVALQKKALRTALKRKLKDFPLTLRQEEDNGIQAHVLAADWFKKSHTVCAYLSCPALREVDTSQIVASMLDQDGDSEMRAKKELYVPRIVDREANMSMLHISTLSDLTVNSLGIVEPEITQGDGSPRRNLMDGENPLDLILMPGLAFDQTGQRLGRGGGYYDVFLERYLNLAKDKGWKRPLLVALAYSVQIVEDPVPVDPTDVPVDGLVLATGLTPLSDSGFKNLVGKDSIQPPVAGL